MGAHTTLKKIAEHLHVSVSTVSRALKDHPDVARETIQRVKDLAQMMDYEPNAFAVGLRKQRSNLFAIIVPSVAHFFYRQFIQAVEEESRKIGRSVLIFQSLDDPSIEADSLKICRHNNVAGIFVALNNNTTNLDPFERMRELHNFPLLFFDKVPDESGFHKVEIADEHTGRQAAQILLESGAHHILALFGNEKSGITRKRKNGFAAAMAGSASYTVDYQYADNMEMAEALAADYLRQSTSHAALFCMNDEILCGAMLAIQKLHIKVPEDCSILALSAGFIPQLYVPKISYIETSGYLLGKHCFNRMMMLSANKTDRMETALPCSFIAGGSI